MSKKAKKGDKVKVEYTGTLKDGTVFDSTEKHGKPLEFEIGGGKIIPAFEKAIKGMKKGETKETEIKSKDAYGTPDPKKVQEIPKDKIPTDKELKKGMMISVGLPNGQRMPAKIKKVTDEKVTLDLNHPLAGKDLNFKFKLVGVN